MNKKKAKTPKLSGIESVLLKKQMDALDFQLASAKQSEAQFKMLQPILFKQMGLKPLMDAKGNITGFEEIPDELAPLRKSSEKLTLERSIAALEGRLPVSPQLKQELASSRETFEEKLRRSLGPDFAASTAGSEGLAKFGREEENVLESARRGDITLGESLSLARGASEFGRSTGTLGSLMGIGQGSLPFGQAFGSAAAGFSGPMGMLMNLKQLQAQTAANNSSNSGGWMQGLAGIGNLAGTLALAPTTGGGSLFGNLFA